MQQNRAKKKETKHNCIITPSQITKIGSVIHRNRPKRHPHPHYQLQDLLNRLCDCNQHFGLCFERTSRAHLSLLSARANLLVHVIMLCVPTLYQFVRALLAKPGLDSPANSATSFCNGRFSYTMFLNFELQRNNFYLKKASSKSVSEISKEN